MAAPKVTEKRRTFLDPFILQFIGVTFIGWENSPGFFLQLMGQLWIKKQLDKNIEMEKSLGLDPGGLLQVLWLGKITQPLSFKSFINMMKELG